MSNIKKYLLENYERNEIEDIANHGCSGGVGGFIYYHETTKFHDEHEDEIWDMLNDEAENHGLTIMQLLAQFQGQKHVGNMAQLKNLLCWYAVEARAAEIINEDDNEEK